MKVKEINNYPHLKLEVVDKDTLENFTLVLVPTRLKKDGDNVMLNVDVFFLDEFEAGKESTSPFSRLFPISYETAKTEYASFFSLFETAFLDWLEVSDSYYLKSFDINLKTLQIKGKAEHKTNVGKVSKDETSGDEEFEEIKINYPELVQGFAGFSLTYAKTNDTRLAKFI